MIRQLSTCVLLMLGGCQPFFYWMESTPPVRFGPDRHTPSEAVMPPELFDSGVSRDTSDLMGRWFKDAQTRLKAIVLNPPGGTVASQQYRAAFAAQRVNQIDDVLRQLKAKTSGWAGKNIPAAATDGIKLANRQAVEAGVKLKASAVTGSFSLIDARTIQKLAQDTVGDLHGAIDSMGGRAKSVLRQTAQLGLAEADINRVLAAGVIEGKPRETVVALRKELQAVHGDTVEINGRNYDVRSYAELVVRTKTRQASVHARHDRLQSLGLTLVSIVGRISNNFCSAYLGQVFSLDGKSGKYPSLSSLQGGGPPFHPNCSKSTRPFVEELASDAQLEQADGIDDAQALLNRTPTEAQRAYKDLQLHAQVKQNYATTAGKLFG